MKLPNRRFLLTSVAVLALALPASSEPLFWYTDAEEYYEEPVEEYAEEPIEQIQPVQVMKPVIGASASNAAKSGRAGIAAPVATTMAQRANTARSRQQVFSPSTPGGRNVSSRAATTSRSAVPMQTQQRARTTTSRSAVRTPTSARGQTQSRSVNPRATIGRATQQLSTFKPAVPAEAPTAPTTTSARAVAPQAATSNASAGNRNTATARKIDNALDAKSDIELLQQELDIATETAALNAQIFDTCQTQYFGCMDDICTSVNDELGRCACSPKTADIYKETQDALKEANLALQDSVRNIQYLGLSQDEVISLFEQTEAELALTQYKMGDADKSELRKMITDIGANLPDYTIEPPANLSMLGGAFLNVEGLDLNLTLGFGGTKQSFSDISNMSSQNLYNASKEKCQTILTDCQKKKVDIELLQSKYDIEIGKSCVVFRDSLEEQVNNMKNMNRNAQILLERARFQVAQSKNSLDLKGCVTELDKCMIDDYVCGKDYSKCIDVTGRWVSVNGDVVAGADLVLMQHYLWNGPKNSVDFSVLAGMSKAEDGTTNPRQSVPVVSMLTDRIGKVGSDGYVTEGYCAGVMKQCQRYSYNSDGKTYNENNDVVKNYLYQALPKIMAAQDTFIAEYQTQCVSDLKSCYQTQLAAMTGGYYSYGGSTSAAVSVNMLNTLLASCDSIGLSCAYAVFSGSDNVFLQTDTTYAASAAAACKRQFNANYDEYSNAPNANNCIRNVSTIPLRGLITCQDSVRNNSTNTFTPACTSQVTTSTSDSTTTYTCTEKQYPNICLANTTNNPVPQNNICTTAVLELCN